MPLANCLELVNSHKMAAIQLVNQQLQDVRTATRPSVITAIYLLAAQEVGRDADNHWLSSTNQYEQQMTFDNDVEASRAHLLGLRDVIRLRGGFDGLPLPFMTYLIV